MEELKDILNEIVKDYGLKILEDPQKFKAVFADYAKGEYSAEKDLFTKIIEIGATKEIRDTEDILTTKKTLVKKLHDKYFLDEKILDDYLDIFISFLRNDYTVTKKTNNIKNLNNNYDNKKQLKVRSLLNNSFEEEVFKMLKTNKIPLINVIAGWSHPIVKFYKLKTGKNIYQSRYDVMRLNYFVIKEIQDQPYSEEDWQKEWNEVIKPLMRKRAILFWWFCLLIITIPMCVASALTYEYMLAQYKKNGL